MNSIITQKDIVSGLRDLGIEPGMDLEVHSSLKSFGHVEGGAGTVIAALKEAVGADGSIFMPSLRLSSAYVLSPEDRHLGITCKIKILPPDEQHSAMGAIADTFRQMPDVKTGDGVFRVSAWGKHGNEVKNGFQYLLDHGGKGLLLGVDIYKLTAMHYVEDLLPQRIRDILKPSEEVNRLYPPEEWFVECGEPPVKAWYAIQNAAYEKGLIKDGMIGNCKCMFFPLREVVGLYREALKNDPCKLYGIKS